MRRPYVDWARGLAVLIMIEAHAFDAWTNPVDRATATFRNLTILGGFAAPLFLWLAGLAAALSAESAVDRTGDRRKAALLLVRRGVEIYILAFLFRLQALIVTPGSPLITLFRVDILNVMGPSLAVSGLIWGMARSRLRPIVTFGLLSGVIAVLTPVIRAAEWPGNLPIWLQWHLRPAGEHTNFTFLPWTGFVFAGVAAGLLLSRSTESRSERLCLAGMGLFGLTLVLSGFGASRLPTIYWSSSFWTSSPSFFAIRVGLLMSALSVVYAGGLMLRRAVSLLPLERLGRSSLFIYWIHVELVYGYASWPLQHRLELWQTMVAYALLRSDVYGCRGARLDDRAMVDAVFSPKPFYNRQLNAVLLSS